MRNTLLSILAGIIFSLTFFVSYSRIPDHYYKNRDDAVITLSHAKNFIEFGHIGVSPSGGRTEGYSSHFNFWLYTIIYPIVSLDWKTFFIVQTWIATFLLGVIIFHFFSNHTPITSVMIVLFFALCASTFFRFLEWHGSGMENAWMHVIFLYLILKMSASIKNGKLYYSVILIGFSATLIRTEAVYHILPVLILYTIFYFRSKKEKKVFFHLSAILILWAAYNLWRIYYFGNFIPNTGVAQNISPSKNLLRIVSLDLNYIKEYIKYSFGIVYFHGIYLLIPALGFLFYLKLKNKLFLDRIVQNSEFIFILLTTIIFAITSFFYPLIFGIARMDFTRTTTFIVPFILLTLFLIYTLLLNNYSNSLKKKFIVSILFLSVLFLDFSIAGRKPKIIGWEIEWYNDIILQADKFSEENSIHRLNLANPDLGKISFVKKYNIFDLGMLGSPLITSVVSDKELFKYYFYNFALPDFIAVHEFWSGYYKFLFFDKRFYNYYQPIFEKRTEFLNEKFPDEPQIMEGYYVRKDLLSKYKSREWIFINELKKNISVERIKQELDKSLSKNDYTSHQYVVRTVFRFIPELKRLKLYHEVLKLFENSPSYLYDKAILSSSDYGSWYNDAKKFLIESYHQSKNFNTKF